MGSPDKSWLKEVEFPASDYFQRMKNIRDLKQFWLTGISWYISGGVHQLQFSSNDGKQSEIFGGSYSDWHLTTVDVIGPEIRAVQVWWNEDGLRGIHFLDNQGKILVGDYDACKGFLEVDSTLFKLDTTQVLVGVRLRVAGGVFGYVGAIKLKLATFDL